MRRVIGITAVLLTLLIPTAFAQTAVVKQISGAVQILPPGGSWKNASVGSVITQGTVVSTGFGSSAVLDLGTSQLQVKQLTRMRLEELLRTQTSATTTLFLTVGQVRANVDNTLAITQKFTLKSPVSTAAVRGTVFDFGLFGVTVERGIVHFANQYNVGREVSAGETSKWNGVYVPGTAEEFEQAQTTTSTKTNVGETQSAAPKKAAPTTGSVAVSVTVGS